MHALVHPMRLDHQQSVAADEPAPVYLAVPPCEPDWEQYDLVLPTDRGPLRELTRPFFEALQDALHHWRRRADVECWFVRKSPGLRLRLRGPGYGDDECRQLVAIFAREAGRNALVRWRRSTYEPEVFRLGGPQALRAIHALFSAQTTVWLAWQRLSGRRATRLAAELMALAVYGDLLARVLPAHEEAWDVWCSLAQRYGGGLPQEPTQQVDGWYLSPTALAARASTPERVLLERSFADNQQLCEQLAAIESRDQLVGGLRGLVASIGTFHWNRWCMPVEAIRRICIMAVQAYHPTADLLPPSAGARA